MDADLERVRKGLEEAAQWAKTYRFELTDDYLKLIARVEAMPSNQSGADKSGVWRAQRAYRNFFKNARLVSRDDENPLAPLGRTLAARSVHYLSIGVSGANLYAPGGQARFHTEDYDLFLPADADNLVRAWAACGDVGLELWLGDEPLDRPRDQWLAEQIVTRRALTRVTGAAGLQIDLTMVDARVRFRHRVGRATHVRSRGCRDSNRATSSHHRVETRGWLRQGQALPRHTQGRAGAVAEKTRITIGLD